MSRQPQPKMPAAPTLPQLQQHLAEVCHYFAWDKCSNEKTFLLFIEEVGELAKAMRKIMGLSVEQGTEQSKEAIQANVAEEMADCLIYLMDLANRFQVDLAAAYAEKTERNFTRIWHVEKN